MHNRKTFIYNPSIVATKENLAEASQQFNEVMKNAPKPCDHLDKKVIVNPKFTVVGETINIMDLLAAQGFFTNNSNTNKDGDIPAVQKKNNFS